jgi:hypothetical protein
MLWCLAMALFERLRWSGSRPVAAAVLATTTMGGAAGCSDRGAVLTEQIDAMRLASDLRVQFTKAADAGNRAVMADTDAASEAAAREAQQATEAAKQDVERLQPILKSLGYSNELRSLDRFIGRFDEFRKLDAEILPLAVENTNLKAQRLSFGAAQEAADRFRTAVDAAAKAAESKNTCCIEALAAKGRAALLEIQVIQARHIAEPEDGEMTRMEAQMAASEAEARRALDELKRLAPSAGSELGAAAAALDRFKSINGEIVTLSRRNTNVRSLALSLGRKRTVTAECDDQLRALEEGLAKHKFAATR